MKSREEIIAEALLVQIDTEAIRPDFFTSMDILTVARIGKEELEKVKALYCEQVNVKKILRSISIS